METKQMHKKLILVMGTQRSGTTALFKSLAADRRLSAFHEHRNSPVFKEWNLRPVSEVRQVMDSSDSAVLMKPINETTFRSVLRVMDDYQAYDTRVVWIYRDPVDVFCSTIEFFLYPRRASDRFYAGMEGSSDPMDKSVEFAELWKRRNEYAVEAQAERPDRVCIVRYEDLIKDPKVFSSLCRWLDVRGQYIFFPNPPRGRSRLPEHVVSQLTGDTGSVLSMLDAGRSCPARVNLVSQVLRGWWWLRHQFRRRTLRSGSS